MKCKVPDCDDDIRARGMCNKHYRRFLKTGRTKLNISSVDHRMMSQREWDTVLSLEQISDLALVYLVGFGAWRKHCARFKSNRALRVNLLRHMTLTQQCLYYRKAAFIQRGQS